MNVLDMESYKHTNNRRRNKKRYKFPTPIIYIFIVFVGLYFFIHSPVFNIKYINVTGHKLLAEDKILSLSQLSTDQNIMKIKKEEIIKKISLHPLIKDVQIKRRLPHTVEIHVSERKPVGLLVSQDGFIQVSEEGYFLALVQDIGEYPLPVLSGITLEELPGPGQIINNNGLFLALDIIKESPAELLDYLVDINIANKSYVLAYTLDGIEIRLGSTDDIKDKLVDLLDILEDFNERNINPKSIEYLDLRFSGPPIIKRK
ncbi:MAG: cell division protein FtsQ/DivIB [Peptococcales bacterium]|jgi:cell division protein FtsQ